MNQRHAFDCAIVGGGVIGLSIAFKLAESGRRVALIERGELAREASWAGAGILPPCYVKHATHPMEMLAARSFELHAAWARQIKEETGIDNGFQRCGALFIARTHGELASLAAQRTDWMEQGVQVQDGTEIDLSQLAPSLAQKNGELLGTFFVPDEAQIRNPDHARGLIALCLQHGVELTERAGDVRVAVSGSRVQRLIVQGNAVEAECYCIATGAWSSQLLGGMGVSISVLPVRGQMLLFKLDRPPLGTIVYEGLRYVVARRDGHVLVGSTTEHAGFDKRNTSGAVAGLKEFASSIDPRLNDDSLVDQWAGLRPGTFDGFPYIGSVPGIENAWVACGHYRSGLLMSPGTAEIMTDLITGKQPSIDISPFRLDRG